MAPHIMVPIKLTLLIPSCTDAFLFDAYFFTIKHREREGKITSVVAEELREYMREQIDD